MSLKQVVLSICTAGVVTGCVQVNDQVITTGDLLNSAAQIYSTTEDSVQNAVQTATAVKNSAVKTYEEVSATAKDLQEKAELLQKLIE